MPSSSRRGASEHASPASIAGLRSGRAHLIIYHYVVEGDFHIRVEGENGEGLVIGAGEIVLVPRNDPHLMGSDLSLRPVEGRDIVEPPEAPGRTPSIMAVPADVRGWSAGSLVAPASKAIRNLEFAALVNLRSSKAEPRNGFAQRSNTPRRRSLLVVQDRRPRLPSFRSCCSWRRCGVTWKAYQMARSDGWPACASLTSREHLRCYTATSPGAGPSTTLAARSAIVFGAGGPLHSIDRFAADALPGQLAHADRGREAPKNQRIACTGC